MFAWSTSGAFCFCAFGAGSGASWFSLFRLWGSADQLWRFHNFKLFICGVCPKPVTQSANKGPKTSFNASLMSFAFFYIKIIKDEICYFNAVRLRFILVILNSIKSKILTDLMVFTQFRCHTLVMLDAIKRSYSSLTRIVLSEGSYWFDKNWLSDAQNIVYFL